MSYEYTYLLMGLVFGVFWLGFFYWRKDTRKEMLSISVIGAFAGPTTDILYTQDWWRPISLTGQSIAPEGILVGFMIAGIAAVAYEDLFAKRMRIKKTTQVRKLKMELDLFKTLLLSAVLLFGSFYMFAINSLYATFLATIIPTIIIWIQRKDLIINSFASGIILVCISIVVYFVLELLTPGWVDAFWKFENTPSLIFMSLPIDDVIWYFVTGMFMGPLYEFWKEGRLY